MWAIRMLVSLTHKKRSQSCVVGGRGWHEVIIVVREIYILGGRKGYYTYISSHYKISIPKDCT